MSDKCVCKKGFSKILAFWPFIFILAVIIYVYLTNYLGYGWLSSRGFNENMALPLIGLAFLSFFLLACKTKNELAMGMTFLCFAFFCREWHFAGTSKGVYVAIALFVGWFVYRRNTIEAMITGKRIKVWLFATASCYLMAQLVARRVFAEKYLGLLPMEEQYHISLEETLEGAAHILMIITSIIAWKTFNAKDAKVDNLVPEAVEAD